MAPDPTPPGLLSGVRVIEYGRNITAPFAGKILADLGAEVIKVEPPEGEPTRALGPFQGDAPNPEAAAQFIYLNGNKRGVTLDLDRPSGRALLDGLLRGADLITWHASALGHRYLGEPDREPLRSGGSFASYYAAVNAAAATLLALRARESTGRGTQVDISVADVLAVGILGYGLVALYHERGLSNRRPGNSQRLGVPAAMLPCRDGYVFIFASESYMWDGLVKAMGDPEWARADIFKGHYRDRSVYGAEIYGMMQGWLDATGKEEIFQRCQENRVPSTAVYDMAEVLGNSHLAERGFFVTTSHPVAGPMRQPGAPYKLGAGPWALRRPAPRLGEHNDEVLREGLGLGRRALTDLRRAGVV